MDGGEGILALDEGEAWRLLQEVGSLFPYLVNFGFVLFLADLYSCCALFSGIGGTGKCSVMKEEVHKLEAAAQEMETRGLEKVEAVVAGLEAGWFLWASDGSHSTTLLILSPTPPRRPASLPP